MTSDEHGSDSFSVLIVDDDPNFRALMKVLIETTGCQVLEARSGKDADVLLGQYNPSLLIVDYRLPGLDGMQWITKFRQAGYNTPIIFLSGTWCDLSSFTKLRSLLKVNLILQKPILPELFLDQIESLLPHSGGAGSMQQPWEDEDTNSYEAYAGIEPRAALYEAYQSMDAELEPLLKHAEGVESSESVTNAPQPEQYKAVSHDHSSDDLRSLFEKEVLDSQPADSSPRTTNLIPHGRDAMRKSATRMPAQKKPAQQNEAKQTPPTTEGELPTQFNEVPLSRDNPDEMEVITSAEPDAIEQLTRFSQKAHVEMALRSARADYAKLLPEKVQSVADALGSLKADPSNAEHYEEALQGVHQLKGTAGSLGFPHLGKTAGILERLLLDGGTRDARTGDKAWPRIDRQLSQLLEIARANSLAYSQPDGSPRKAFVRKVAFVGPYQHFADVTHMLAKENIAEAYLIDNIAALLNEKETDVFNCVVVDSAALEEQSPTELLEQARQTTTLQNSPFAFISDDSWRADEALWLYTGAEFLLPQSVTPAVLKNVVVSMLDLNEADKPRVLTIDDDVVLTGFICDTLSSHGITAKALNEPINVLAALSEFPADLILLDVVMPGVSGYDVCRTLRADAVYSQLPILFLTSKNSQQGRAAAFKAGGDDFLSKPILTEELLTRVRSRLELSKPFKQRAGTNNQTGLTTRQAFLEVLARSLAAAQKAGNVYTVAIITIHQFQELALSLGFSTQEQIFKDLAKLLQARFRIEDLKGHWSEGSFALAFPNVEADVIDQAMTFLAGEFAVGSTHNSSGKHTMSKRLIRYGLGELLTDGVTADTMLSHAYEKSMRSTPIDVSGFFELYQDESIETAILAEARAADAAAATVADVAAAAKSMEAEKAEEVAKEKAGDGKAETNVTADTFAAEDRKRWYEF